MLSTSYSIQRKNAPHNWIVSAYGTKFQYALSLSTLPILDKKATKRVQYINGTFLYYVRSIDGCMLPATNNILVTQSNPTSDTNKECAMLMDYAHIHPNAVIRYHTSDMRLYIDSDAAYLVMPKERSRGAGYFYLSNNSTGPDIPRVNPNGSILTQCTTIKKL